MQSNETLMGIKTSFETMTQSVRETLVETWALEEDFNDEYEQAPSGYVDELTMTFGDDQIDGKIPEAGNCEQTESDGSSLHSNNDEGSINESFIYYVLIIICNIPLICP